MASRPDVRIGNAERDKAADQLGEHFRAGRLDMHEYDERITAAYAAKTSANLDVLFADLPRSGPAAGPARERRGMPVGALLLRAVALAVLGAAVIALVLGATPFLLVGFLVWGRATGRLCGGRRYYGHRGYNRAGAWG